MLIDRRTAIAGALGGALALPTAASAGRPGVPKEVLAFYYGWYANPTVSKRWFHWQGPTGREAPAQSPLFNYPRLGLYDSHSWDVVKQHAAWSKAAGLTGLISSWWGPGSFEDQSTALLLEAARLQGLKVSVYLEAQKGGAAGAERDLRYLMEHYVDHPTWLKVDGRPVFFIYLQALEDCPANVWRDAAKRIAASGLPEPVLIGDVSPREPYFASRAPYMDGTHVYVMAPYIAGKTPAQIRAYTDATYPDWKAKSAGRIHCATVIPGFNDTRVPGRPQPRPTVARNGTGTFAELWRAAIKTDADWVLVTSFNEWHEGSDIEPSREWGTTFLSANRVWAQRFLSG